MVHSSSCTYERTILESIIQIIAMVFRDARMSSIKLNLRFLLSRTNETFYDLFQSLTICGRLISSLL